MRYMPEKNVPANEVCHSIVANTQKCTVSINV